MSAQMVRAVVDDRVLWVTLDRPEKRNALTPEGLDALRRTLEQYAADDDVCALVLRGAGGAFCAGYDVAKIPRSPGVGGRMVPELDAAVAALAAFPAPTIAWIDGPAYGAGVELALACDLRLMRDDARLCMPPAKLGLMYSLEGMARLQAAIGEQRARLMLFAGRVVGAAQAARWGFVLGVYSDAELETEVDVLLADLRAARCASLRSAKITLVAHAAEPDVDLVERTERLRAELFASAR
jgi:enoyl-CoA hydratase/carnithine racemase